MTKKTTFQAARTTFATIDDLKVEVERLTKQLERVAKCSCGGYVSNGYVNPCAASGIAKRALNKK